MVTEVTRMKLRDLNEFLTCRLCDGYLIDATTIVECLHSFCRTCIVHYLHTSNYCPTCDCVVYKKNPHQSIRSDRLLQDIVYKIVPGLFKEELRRRQEYFIRNNHPKEALKKVARPSRRKFFSQDENISLCLEFSSRKSIGKKTNDSNKKQTENRRYLLCPAKLTIKLLKKFLVFKFSLHSKFQIDMWHSNERLHNEYTLIDVAYVTKWKRKRPLRISYAIYEDVTMDTTSSRNSQRQSINACANSPGNDSGIEDQSPTYEVSYEEASTSFNDLESNIRTRADASNETNKIVSEDIPTSALMNKGNFNNEVNESEVNQSENIGFENNETEQNRFDSNEAFTTETDCIPSEILDKQPDSIETEDIQSEHNEQERNNGERIETDNDPSGQLGRDLSDQTENKNSTPGQHVSEYIHSGKDDSEMNQLEGGVVQKCTHALTAEQDRSEKEVEGEPGDSMVESDCISTTSPTNEPSLVMASDTNTENQDKTCEDPEPNNMADYQGNGCEDPVPENTAHYQGYQCEDPVPDNTADYQGNGCEDSVPDNTADYQGNGCEDSVPDNTVDYQGNACEDPVPDNKAELEEGDLTFDIRNDFKSPSPSPDFAASKRLVIDTSHEHSDIESDNRDFDSREAPEDDGPRTDDVADHIPTFNDSVSQTSPYFDDDEYDTEDIWNERAIDLSKPKIITIEPLGENVTPTETHSLDSSAENVTPTETRSLDSSAENGAPVEIHMPEPTGSGETLVVKSKSGPAGDDGTTVEKSKPKPKPEEETEISTKSCELRDSQFSVTNNSVTNSSLPSPLEEAEFESVQEYTYVVDGIDEIEEPGTSSNPTLTNHDITEHSYSMLPKLFTVPGNAYLAKTTSCLPNTCTSVEKIKPQKTPLSIPSTASMIKSNTSLMVTTGKRKRKHESKNPVMHDRKTESKKKARKCTDVCNGHSVTPRADKLVVKLSKERNSENYTATMS